MNGGTRKLKNKGKRRKLGKGQSNKTKQRKRLQNIASRARDNLQRASIRTQIQRAARTLKHAVARARTYNRRTVKLVPVRMDTGETSNSTQPRGRLTARQQDKKIKNDLEYILKNLDKLEM